MKQPEILCVEHVTKQFSSTVTPAVDRVSFALEKGDLLGLLGPSGCGKTTLLRILAGFEKPSEGTVKLAGRVVSSSHDWVPPEKRNTGMVFQDYALFPHLTVAQNIAFGLRKKGDIIKQRVAQVLELVGLAQLAKRYPHQLSGGQQQRVALARALAPQPTLMLLDEPLSNLDVQVRQRLRQEVRQILKSTQTSAIFVTHDQEEALAISDQIAVMRQGKIEQIGTPESIYTQPASRFVAEFVTSANFLPAQRYENLWKTEIGAWELSTARLNGQTKGELMLRQEDVILLPDETSSIVVLERQFLGREYRYCVESASGQRLYVRTEVNTSISVGTRVRLSIDSQALQFFG